MSAKNITFDEITDYLENYCKILFVDNEELRAAETYFSNMQNRSNVKAEFITYRDFLLKTGYGLSSESMHDYLKELIIKGVKIYNLVWEKNHNNNDYWKKLCIEIHNKFIAIGKKQMNKVYPEMYQEFFDEIYTEEYAKNITGIKYSVETISGIKMLKDCCNDFYHVIHGERYTLGQPSGFSRTIYFVGPCYIYGHHSEDCNTIESFLQKKLNEANYKIKVVNCGSLYSGDNIEFSWMRLKSLPIRRGDIIIYGGWEFADITKINLLDVCQKYDVPAKWMTDNPQHCNHRLNSLYADAIYDELVSALAEDAIGQREPLKDNSDFVKTVYIDRYFSSYNFGQYDMVGAIVMNCNPFTKGHRYLIERARRSVDFLIIFVVEENASLFTFAERYAMVCEGVAEWDNVLAVPSGPFILSRATFPEYFIKETSDEMIQNIENDIIFFAEKIAPYLNIKYRFVGEEPEDMVTNEYNLAMKSILPGKGIQLIEIPRVKLKDYYISASLVRKCLGENDRKKVSRLVPESTERILFR